MRLGTYFRTLSNTITNPKYYVDVLNVRLWFSVRFLIMSYILMAVLGSVLFAVIDVPKLQSSLSTFVSASATAYPDSQVLQWSGTQLSLVGTDIYSVPFPQLPDAQGTPPVLLTVVPSIKDVNQIQQSPANQSMFVAGAQTIYVAQPGGGWSDLPLTEILGTNEFHINKEFVKKSEPQVQSQLTTTLRALPFLFSGFFFFVSFPFRLLSVIIDTIFIFFMVKISGIPLSFKKIAQVSMHVMVAAELVSILTANFSHGLQMFSLAFWGYTFLIYWNLRHIKALSPIEAERLSKESQD